MFICDVAAEHGRERKSALDTALPTQRTVLHVVGHLDAVLGHHQVVDFLLLIQRVRKELRVAVDIIFAHAEVMTQLVVGNTPPNPYEDTLTIECEIDRDDGSSYFDYFPTDAETQLMKDLITEKIQEV